MTTHEEPRGDAEPDESLLTDEEFTALMEAEHEAATRARGDDGIDAVRRQGVWRAIESELPAPAPGRGLALWAGPLAMAALIYLGLSSFLMKDEHESERLKGADAGIPVRLSAYVASGGAGFKRFEGGRLKAGETLVFDVNATQPGLAALMVREGKAPLRPAYKVMVPRAGEDTPMAHAGESYGYKLDPGDPATKICAIAAADEDALSKVMEFLPPRFDDLPADACVTLEP